MNTIPPFTEEELDAIRMKDIVCQLTDVIFILCNAKKLDSITILSQLTNLSYEEQKQFCSLISK